MAPPKKFNFGSTELFPYVYGMTSEVLGTGAFGVVYRGIRTKDEESVAIKVIDKRKQSAKELNGLRQEVCILQSLDHPNVVRFYEAFEDRKEIYLVMENIKGKNLDQLYESRHTAIRESEVRNIIFTVGKAVQYCNSKGVVHRDLKPSNIIVVGVGDEALVKIIDFNLSKQVDSQSITQQTLTTMNAGTPMYMAPEVRSGNAYNFKCDIWSLGVIAFEFLVECLPFGFEEGDSLSTLYSRMDNNEWSFTPERDWQNVSHDAKDLIKHLIVLDPKERFDYTQMLNHPWFKADKTLFPTATDREKAARRRLQIDATVMSMAARNAFAELMESESDISQGNSSTEDFFA